LLSMTARPISHESRRGPERVAVVLMLVVVAVLLVAGVVPHLAGYPEDGLLDV
jgi:hypothetical protein